MQHAEQTLYENMIPRWTPESALKRQYLNTLRPLEFARDIVASTADGENPEEPAKIGDQLFEVNAAEGCGYVPVVASRPIYPKNNELYTDIRTIYKIYHGELGNVWDYFDNFMAALRPFFDPDTMLVVAQQFPRSVDQINNDTLRWGINYWRSLEPAEYPSPPIGALKAADALDFHLIRICPHAKIICERYNSEGSQMGDRRLRWSRALFYFESIGGIVDGRIQNAGSYQYDNPYRPKLLNPDDQCDDWIYDWDIPKDPLVDRWPLGIFDPNHADFAMHGPPPDVLRFILEHSVDEGNRAYLRRARISIAENDSDPNGSRVPKGVGFNEQGRTRFERAYGRWRHLREFSKVQDGRSVPITILRNLGHAAADNFRVNELGEWYIRAYELYGGGRI